MQVMGGVHGAARHGEQRPQAVQEGRAGPQSHQGVHVGGTVPQAFEAADEELLVDDHDDPRQRHFHQADGHVVLVEPGGHGPAGHHMPHGHVHQHRQEAQRPPQPPLEGRGLVIGQRVLIGGDSGLRACRALHRCAVARILHRADDGAVLRRALHAHLVGQQADGHLRDPRHLAHSLFYPGYAGRAGHARHMILFHGNPPPCMVSASASAGSPAARPPYPPGRRGYPG